MAGNFSGSELARQAAALGFQTLHLRFGAVDPDVEKTFPGPDIFAQQWSITDTKDTNKLSQLAHQIGQFAQQSGPPLRGASPGMDLAVYSVDFLSASP